MLKSSDEYSNSFNKLLNTNTLHVIDLEILELKKKMIKLLREDEEFRLAIAGLLGLDAILNELKKLREDFNRHIELEEKRWEENAKWWERNWKLWEESNKRWEENNRRWEEAYKRFEVIETELRSLREENIKLREDFNKLREDFNKLYESVMKRLDLFEKRMDIFEARIERRITALGARWGIESENAFREAMRGIIEEILGVSRVEKWKYYDDKGEVYGYPSQVEVDLVVKDNIHILVEIKASASSGDVFEFWRIGNLYFKVVGVKPRLVLITPFIDDKGLNTAKKLGVEVYTKT